MEEIILIVVFGLAWGSFLNVVIYRLPRNLSLLRPPSSCPNVGPAFISRKRRSKKPALRLHATFFWLEKTFSSLGLACHLASMNNMAQFAFAGCELQFIRPSRYFHQSIPPGSSAAKTAVISSSSSSIRVRYSWTLVFASGSSDSAQYRSALTQAS